MSLCSLEERIFKLMGTHINTVKGLMFSGTKKFIFFGGKVNNYFMDLVIGIGI